MPENKNIYAITECNANDCGKNSTEYGAFSRPLTGNELTQFLQTVTGLTGQTTLCPHLDKVRF